ncbi:FUSC family protein [Alkalimarinus alittae]|uniref:FUSC family protein n=1 Tax=Alkalimarinus alittae TaxID=2961619 RepID=A0ABY6N2A0_9ALTE|nr:FUSC family protein [Alkalimarinus alittae]UZE96150.1 FUSC family protein [Alkalimarinus alittae]
MSSSNNKPGIWKQIQPHLQLSDHKRPLGFLLTVSLAIGGPVTLGVLLGHFSMGVVASIGGLACVYLRQTPLTHRMLTMALVTFGFCTSFTISLLAAFNPWVMAFSLGIVAFWATFICRYFLVPPPGSFFFILVACIASAMPFSTALLAERAGLLLFGCIGACTLALVYSLIQILRGQSIVSDPVEVTEPRLIAIFLESITIASFIAASYLLALWLGFDRPYWAPISCAAILQGVSFRAIQHRNIHRIVGTAIGMGLTWIIFSLDPSLWTLALLIFLLSLIIEILVTRNYGFAVIFITPLTIILAEAQSASLDINGIVLLRMTNVILGSFVGYLGGWLLNKEDLYCRLEQRLLSVRDSILKRQQHR